MSDWAYWVCEEVEPGTAAKLGTWNVQRWDGAHWTTVAQRLEYADAVVLSERLNSEVARREP